MDKQQSVSWRSQVKQALLKPTFKQKEAYGRYSHGLSGVCAIAFVTILFSDAPILNSWIKMTALAVFAAVLFVAGAIFSKGE